MIRTDPYTIDELADLFADDTPARANDRMVAYVLQGQAIVDSGAKIVGHYWCPACRQPIPYASPAHTTVCRNCDSTFQVLEDTRE